MADKTILVVEDNDIQREGTSVILGWHAYAVIRTEDPVKALTYLRTNPRPDLILLDMLFPDGVWDGWRFLEELKGYPHLTTIPVLIITGVGIACDEWASALGAVGCLKKPVDTESLIEAVRRYAVGGSTV
jgi:CheY-like chemotaxis protein